MKRSKKFNGLSQLGPPPRRAALRGEGYPYTTLRKDLERIAHARYPRSDLPDNHPVRFLADQNNEFRIAVSRQPYNRPKGMLRKPSMPIIKWSETYD